MTEQYDAASGGAVGVAGSVVISSRGLPATGESVTSTVRSARGERQ
jgi:hypothetical protein